MSQNKAEQVIVNGPAGKIEAVVSSPARAAVGCAVIAHPHPLYGGTLDNKVVQTLSKAFVSLGYISVRFNFRGVGDSDGVYDEGRGELEDFMSVLEYSKSRYAPQKWIYAGFSFGTYVVSHAAKLTSADQLVLIAPAAGKFDVADVPEDTLVVHGENDDVVELEEVFAWARPQKLPVTVFPGAGHFFHGDLIKLQRVVTQHCRDYVVAPTV